MKINNIITYLMIGLMVAALASCQKDNIDETTTEEEEVTEVVTCDDWTMAIVDTEGPNGNGNLSPVSDGGTPPYIYLWSTGDSTENIVVNNVGNYSLTITDSEGCIVSDSINVEFNDPCNGLTVEVTEVTDTITTLNSFVQGGTAPFLYEWSNGETTQNINVTEDGLYTLIVIDVIGCTSQYSVQVANNTNSPCDDFSMTLAEQPPGSGDLYTSVSGGTPGYAYFWSTGESTSSISTDSIGVYSVSVTDSNGCVLWEEIQL